MTMDENTQPKPAPVFLSTITAMLRGGGNFTLRSIQPRAEVKKIIADARQNKDWAFIATGDEDNSDAFIDTAELIFYGVCDFADDVEMMRRQKAKEKKIDEAFANQQAKRPPSPLILPKGPRRM